MPPDPQPQQGLLVSRLALLLALVLFLFLGAYQLLLPGLHYDEAREAGVNAMQLVTGQPVTAFRDATVRIGSVELPLMVQDYIGASNVILGAPFLALGGVNVIALRWLPLTLAAITLALVWKVAGDLGGPIAATVAVLLLAVNPGFVFWSRQGVFVTNLIALLFIAALCFGLRWLRGGAPADLYATAFLCGLGVYGKLSFAWAIGGMVIVGLVGWALSRRNASRPAGGGVAWPVWLGALAAFLIPLVPLILFNLRTGGTLTSIFDNLGRSYYGVENAAFGQNLAVRAGQVVTLLRGDHFWYLGETFANAWAPWLAGGLLVAALVAAPPSVPQEMEASGQWPSRGALLAVAGMFLLIVAQSAFTVSDLFITHYALILPLIPLGAGLAVAALVARPGKRGQLVAAAALAAALVWATGDLWTTVRYHDVLSRSGGYAAHSDAIYRLADYLQRYEPAAPLALDWGLDAPVRYLSKGSVNPVEVFGYETLDSPDPGFEERVAPFMEDPRTVYLAHAPEATVFQGRVDELSALAAARGLVLMEEARFFGRSGQPIFIIYRVI